MNNNDIILKALDVTYAYPEEDGAPDEAHAALDGLSADIFRGRFTAIIGHNGSGKSTLAKLLSAMLLPDKGSVTVYKVGSSQGLDTKDEAQNFEIRKTIGMVFQNPDNQLVATIVEDDVAFAPENLGLEPKEIRRRVDDALATVGLSAYATHDTHKLSGGQKQRVAIAGMLAMEPECIIFDESTAMLDPKGRKDIMDTILKLRDKGITVVLITHYMNEAAMADRVMVIDHGKALLTGTPEEVFEKGDFLAAHRLEPPQAALLVQQLKKSGIDIRTKGVLTSADAADAVLEALKKYKKEL